MKYIDEFRDGELARQLAAAMAREAEPARRYNLICLLYTSDAADE